MNDLGKNLTIFLTEVRGTVLGPDISAVSKSIFTLKNNLNNLLGQLPNSQAKGNG